MSAPEITPEARREIAAALAVLQKHQVSSVRRSCEDWPETHQGYWVVPIGSDWQNNQVFRPFWLNREELAWH